MLRDQEEMEKPLRLEKGEAISVVTKRSRGSKRAAHGWTGVLNDHEPRRVLPRQTFHWLHAKLANVAVLAQVSSGSAGPATPPAILSFWPRFPTARVGVLDVV